MKPKHTHLPPKAIPIIKNKAPATRDREKERRLRHLNKTMGQEDCRRSEGQQEVSAEYQLAL